MSTPKDATQFTAEANASVLEKLPFENQEDFELASRGFIANLENPVIHDAEGKPVWDLNAYAFLDEETAPPTVNPSLWRQARLNMLHGLFQVTDRIYQVRGHDLSVISFIEGDSGWIVIDPLISAETAKASLELIYEHVREKPVIAVIYTHSHVDHWGGVKGVVSEADVEVGKARIIAPEGFLEAAVSENIIAGNAMSRRASYMYGSLLPKGAKGQVDAGLGKTTSSGTVTLIPPTDIIRETGTQMMVDGVEIVFQVTPGTEAPAEMNFYFPQFQALCMAENCSHNLHNLYTLRGAEVRDAKAWVYYMNEAIELFADKTAVVFTSHHWPVWGQERSREYIKKQRDMYRYLHDETLRLANHGYTMHEIAEMVKLPANLSREWYNRGYYGSVNHNVKAIYQKYLGFFDGNPANLHPLPPEEASKKYVETMNGSEAILNKARASFEKGEYRWVAQLVNHLVFAEPDNQEARNLQAEALEQLGYTAESGPWRNFYLTGAKELRAGLVVAEKTSTASADAIKAMTLDMFFDYMAVRLNGPKAAGKTIILNFDFTDTGAQYLVEMENSVLTYTANKQADDADAAISLTRPVWNEIVLGQSTMQAVIAAGKSKVAGNPKKLGELFALMDDFEFWFNIVTP